jgi:CBS-domain-containing membrane protein
VYRETGLIDAALLFNAATLREYGHYDVAAAADTMMTHAPFARPRRDATPEPGDAVLHTSGRTWILRRGDTTGAKK